MFAPGRQDETVQRFKPTIPLINSGFERGNLRGDDPQGLVSKFCAGVRNTQIGAQIEQLVLNAREQRIQRIIGQPAPRQSDGRIGLIDAAIGFDANVGFIDFGHVTQARSSLITRAGIDFGQPYHGIHVLRVPLDQQTGSGRLGFQDRGFLMYRIVCGLLILFSPVAAAGQDVQSLVDGLVEAGSPGAVVMVIDDDVQLTSVAGVRRADEETQIDLSDAWHLGSNTKAMTAILAARLVERGLIDWDSRLGDVLADDFDQIDPVLAEATLADLLHHQSGMQANAGRLTSLAIAGILGDRDAQSDRNPYLRELLRNPAGTRGNFLYSNAGYVAAAMMLENVAGESWENLIQTELFDVLALDSAGFGPPLGDQPQGHRAGWRGLSPVGTEAAADNPPAMNPAGRVHMSMPDYAVFLRLVMAGARGEEDTYLSQASWQRLITPPDGADYAMGWGVGADGSLRHAGSNTMWFVQAVIWPDEGRIAVAGVNEGRIGEVAPRISAALTELAPD